MLEGGAVRRVPIGGITRATSQCGYAKYASGQTIDVKVSETLSMMAEMATFDTKPLALLAISFALFVVGGCERPTSVRLKGGISPVFVLSGSGNLTSFSVYVVSAADYKIGRTVASLSDDSFFTEPPVWRIEPNNQCFGPTVGQLDRITYGIVPQCFKQTVPANGSAPIAIVAGKKYFFVVATVNAPGASGGFAVWNGEAFDVPLGLPCLQRQNGKEVTVPCNQACCAAKQ